jgi:ABC-type branched-subunit amino acid transport system substrate-binding protein
MSTVEQLWFGRDWEDMKTWNAIHPSARASLTSVILTALVITVNHTYALGSTALLLGAVLISVPAILLAWFRRTDSTLALGAYLLMTVWIVIGFGLLKGLWETMLPLYLGTWLSSRSTTFARPVVGTWGFAISGVLTFIGSVFVGFYSYKLLEAARQVRFGRVWLAVNSLLVIAIAGAWLVADQDRWVPPRDGVVRIGVIVPTSGPYAMLGGSFVKAAQMARDDLRNTKYNYELVVRDSGPDPALAEDVIQSVIVEDKVDAIVGGISIIGQVTAPLATAARIPHICVCTVTSIGDGAYNFTNIPSPEAEAVAWVGEAQRRGINRFALISQNYPSINNHVRALKSEAAHAGLTIGFEQRFEESVTDFGSIIADAVASRPDVVYVEALNPALDILGRQLVAANVRNVSSVVAPSVSDTPELFEGTWYTDSNLRQADFRTRFELKYPGVRFATHMMPYAYDSVRMIVEAYEQGQNPAVHLREVRTFEGIADVLTKQPGSGNFHSEPAV